VAKGQWPKITLVVLRPPESSINHNWATSAHSVLDYILCHTVVVMPTNPTVLDPLPFGCQIGGKYLGSVDSVVDAICSNVDTSSGSFTFKPKLGLHRVSASKPYLVHHGELGPGGIAEDSALTKLLGSEIVPLDQKLMAKKSGFILV
jgi:hypothetical protein